ncbi:hypothetical protein B0H14DRAFT_3903265 [Mycena olivaceomarginata]|nr:hypothetical protein B0H14DRAFT_3903265 [Mycena olivaceomarginata]
MLSTLLTHLCIFLAHLAGWPLSLSGGDERSIGADLPVVAGVLLVLIVLHFFHPFSTLYPSPTPTAHAAHARLLSWFLNSPAAPFGVHRIALAGKAAGKNFDVAILVHGFPVCGLGVSVVTDDTLYQTEGEGEGEGDRPVLLLLGIRLGLDGVNPIYYETIK